MSGGLATLVSADQYADASQSVETQPNETFWAPAEVTEVPSKAPRESSPVPILYPLTRLENTKLAQPIVVVVESDEDSVIMSSPKLRLWGTGSDVYEALADFSAAFFDVLNSYRQTDNDQLTDGAIEYRQRLESYLLPE